MSTDAETPVTTLVRFPCPSASVSEPVPASMTTGPFAPFAPWLSDRPGDRHRAGEVVVDVEDDVSAGHVVGRVAHDVERQVAVAARPESGHRRHDLARVQREPRHEGAADLLHLRAGAVREEQPGAVAVPEPSLPDVKPPACVNAEDSDATSLPLSCGLPAVVNPTRLPPAIAAWNDAFTPPPLAGRTRKVPSSQPSCSVVLTTLWARISSGPFSCGLLLVAVPAYVAVVSLYVPSLPVHAARLGPARRSRR